MTTQNIAELRGSEQKPGFAAEPRGADRLHLKPEHFPTFDPRRRSQSCLLSIDPGLAGGVANDYSVIGRARQYCLILSNSIGPIPALYHDDTGTRIQGSRVKRSSNRVLSRHSCGEWWSGKLNKRKPMI